MCVLSLSLVQPGSRGFNYCNNAINGAKGIYITGLDILMEACVLCTAVIQKVLMQKKKSGVGMRSPIPLKKKFP